MFSEKNPPSAGRVAPVLLLLLLLLFLLTGCRRVSTLPSDTPVPDEKKNEQSIDLPDEKPQSEVPDPPNMSPAAENENHSSLSPEKEQPSQQTPSTSESDEKTAPPAEQPQTEAQLQAEADALAKKRIQSDIDLALWYVQQNPDSGSAVSYPYEAGPSAYSALSRTQKKLYDEMLPKVRTLTPFAYTAAEYGYDILDNVFVAVSALCADHPECAIYFDIAELFAGDTTTALVSSYFLPSDPDSKNTDDISAVQQELRVFEAECDLIVRSMPTDLSTYDKYRYLAAVISIRTAYDNDFTGGRKTTTAYGAIEGPAAICQGYSIAFAYLCQKADLWCRTVSGVSMEVAHAWNLVKLDSGTYHVDITWADSDWNIPLDEGWHRYFMLTQEQILVDHEIDDGTVATGIPLQPLI